VPWFRDTYADAVRDCGYALRPNEKLVALVYAEHAGDPKNPANDVSWVAWGRLSEQTGIRSKDALNRAVRHLEKRGWLVLVEPRRQHRSPRYRIRVPDQPDVRDTYVWDGPEVREPDDSAPVENPPEVRETDLSEHPAVRPTDHSHPPEVRETTPDVRETTPRGTPHGPDPSTDPSTTDKPPSLERNHKPRASCRHKWTADGWCLKCDRHEPCSDCRHLARINDTIRCHQHQDHQESA
jgi:hypothetical protein